MRCGLLWVSLVLGCSTRATPAQDAPSPAPRPQAIAPLVVVHGGQGSPADRSDGPDAAAQAVWTALEGGATALEAAMAGVESLEDDPRFNAGTGANLRLDGTTIEADAAVMSSDGTFGAVAGISGVRHPVRVARAVADSPHSMLAGEGALAFAGTLGLETRSLATEQARAKLRRGWGRLFGGDPDDVWSKYDWRKHWNFSRVAPTSLAEAEAMTQAPTEAPPSAEAIPDATKDTVGVVVRTADGAYAAALSTGGTTLCLKGRVGDVPQLGAGLYAGPYGAVAATGKGEAITRERVAARTYDLLAEGVHPEDAIQRAIRGITVEEGIGVIAVSQRGYAASATSQMAWAARDAQGTTRADAVIWR